MRYCNIQNEKIKNMNGEQVIPPMTDILGKNWRQPDRQRIELDETHAIMNEFTFKELMEYSLTFPAGKYTGRMWKARQDDKWFLVWYSTDEDPAYICVEWREILIA